MPTVPAFNDPSAIELGVKFQTDVVGQITGIRFYKGAGNTGTHIGNLWTGTGQLLATATFVNETAMGWQQVDFASPVAVTPNTTYVASYHTDTGFYAADTGYFASNGENNPPLRALAEGVDGSNGVFSAGPSAFPSDSFGSANYWVDVAFVPIVDTEAPQITLSEPTNGAVVSGTVTVSAVATDTIGVAGVQFLLNGANLNVEDTTTPFSTTWDVSLLANGVYTLSAEARDSASNLATSTPVTVTVANPPDITPPAITGVTPTNGALGVSVSSNVAVMFDEPMAASSINTATFELRDSANNVVSATVSYDGPTRTATLNPTDALSPTSRYTATMVSGPSGVMDVAGNALVNAEVWSFTTSEPVFTIWDESTLPTVPAFNDPSSIELGVKFQTDVDGAITGIRFYKGVGNTGTHIGNLWTSTGQLLATATFIDETATGWQHVDFTTPVAVVSNTTYVASYHTDVGFYSVDSGYFTSNGVNNPPLRALAEGVDGSNGVFAVGPSAFPTNSFGSGNYWVDVAFVQDEDAPQITLSEPANGSVVSTTVTVSAVVTDNVGVSGVQFQLNGANLGAEGTSPPFLLAWNTLTVVNDVYTLTAVARDGGNNLTTSAPVTVTVNNPPDVTPPTVIGGSAG